MKRILALIILISLFAPIFISTLPTSASAATSTDEIRTAVTQVYEELLSRTSPGEGGASDGAMQLLNHAISGGGRDLIMDESDNFTGTLLRSNMFREGFIEGVTDTFNQLLSNYNQRLVSGITYQYYEHGMKYSYGSYAYSEEIVADKTLSGNPTNSVEWSGAKNSSDDTLILLAGSCISKVIIEKTKTENSQTKYHAHIIFSDNFDFNKGNYSGSDAQLANMLNWLGGLMATGTFITPFNFEAHLEFDIDFENTCTHQTRNFAWVWNGSELASVSSKSWSVNQAERIDEIEQETGKQLDPYFLLEDGIQLRHDRPWTVEFKVKGKNFYLASGKSSGTGVPYLLKTALYVCGGEFTRYSDTDPDTGKEIFYGGREQAAVYFPDYGYQSSQNNVYRIENRIQSDGSNMAYLLINGKELSSMTERITYYQQMERHEKSWDWFNGKDVSINYIYNKSIRYSISDTELEYITIWENGENNAPFSYYIATTIAPTCITEGYTGQVCAQCGDTIKESATPALGHSFDANGSCTRCGHAVPVITSTYTTDLIMPAADLGVSAPDSVLRATLTFTEDGKASATWEAVNLTAFRLFFRDMFVSSYYAMAYGAGITDINEIESFCMESTGMSVTAYMDTIVTEKAINDAFTPASSTGTYSYNDTYTAIFTDLAIMGVSSNPTVENSFVLSDGTLHLNAASWGKPDYTFVCTAK